MVLCSPLTPLRITLQMVWHVEFVLYKVDVVDRNSNIFMQEVGHMVQSYAKSPRPPRPAVGKTLASVSYPLVWDRLGGRKLWVQCTKASKGLLEHKTHRNLIKSIFNSSMITQISIKLQDKSISITGKQVKKVQ